MQLISSNYCTRGYIFPLPGADNAVLDPPSQFSRVPGLCIGLNLEGKVNHGIEKFFFSPEVFKRRSRRTLTKDLSSMPGW